MPQTNRFAPVIDAPPRLAPVVDCRDDVAPADDEVRGEREADDRQNAGGDQALVERAHDRVVGAELDEVRADDRRHDAGGADRQRIHHRGQQHVRAGEEDRGENHRGDDRHRIGLEQVGRHAGAVADIVADVVGDGRGVARIVLGNSGLNLADEVGADVGALGEDAAAQTGENRDQRSAEAKRDQRVDDDAVRRRVTEDAGQVAEITGDAEQREARDQHAGDRARAEGDVEAARQRLRRRLRGADVGANRHVHADKAGRAGQDRADGEADRHRPGEQEAERDEHDDSDAGDGRVLPAQIGLRAFGDRARDLLHPLGAGIRRHDAADGINAVYDRQQPAENDQP